jgi:predicted nucleic acid-binding protein
MANFFLDSSGVVKRYVLETGSEWVNRISDPNSGHIIIIVRITIAEVVAAFWKKVREGIIPAQEAKALTEEFIEHVRTQYFVLEVTPEVIDEAVRLIEKHGLRGYDAVQLASAILLHRRRQQLGLPPLIFVSADEDLLAAAQAEGLVTENPNLKA